jgi:hypothetical protein
LKETGEQRSLALFVFALVESVAVMLAVAYVFGSMVSGLVGPHPAVSLAA